VVASERAGVAVIFMLIILSLISLDARVILSLIGLDARVILSPTQKIRNFPIDKVPRSLV
jgi:hypothetical protein